MAVSFDSYLDSLRMDAPNCPEEVMLDAVRKSVIRFCDASHIWREDLDLGDIVAGVNDYSIVLDPGMRMISPSVVFYNGRELTKRTEQQLDVEDAGWRSGKEGTPTKYVTPEPGRVVLDRVPTESITDGLYINASIKPDPTATEAADVLYFDWFEAIQHGARQILFSQREKPWSDPNLAIFEGRWFRYYQNQARINVSKGHAGATLYAASAHPV